MSVYKVIEVIGSSSNSSVATISGNIVTIVGAGSTILTASQAGNSNYSAATSVPQSLTVNKASQAITFNTLADVTFGDADFDLLATSNSGSAISYSSSNTGVATINGNTVTIVGAGSTTITATQSGNGNYIAATNVQRLLTVDPASQSITFNALANKTYGDATFTLSAAVDSGLPISYSSSNTSVASINGNTVTILGAGFSNISANQVGDANYMAAAGVTQILTIDKASQAISFAVLPTRSINDAPFPLSASASSNLAVSYHSSNTSVATISGTTVTIVGSGSTTITSSQPGNANYLAAPDVSRELIVDGKLAQTITFNALSSKTFGNAAFDLVASSSSGLGVSFVSSNTSVATITGNRVTILASGTTDITASQNGDGTYNTASSVTRTLTILKAPQTISFTALTVMKYGSGTLLLTASSSSALEISYTSSNSSVATVTDNVVTLVGVGSTTITASQPGNANVLAASDEQQVLTVDKAIQTITFSAVPTKSMTDLAFPLSASSSSGLTVGFGTASNKITLAGSQVTIVQPGSVTITASQEGNGLYAAAPNVSITFCITPPKPTIVVTGSNTETPTLTSSSIQGNQWYRNGILLSGQINASLQAAQAGVYTTIVTIDGCSSDPSLPSSIIITGYDIGGPVNSFTTILYPNPATGTLTVSLGGFEANEVVEIQVSDLQGRFMMSEQGRGQSNASIDVSSLPHSKYLIRLKGEKMVLWEQFIKN